MLLFCVRAQRACAIAPTGKIPLASIQQLLVNTSDARLAVGGGGGGGPGGGGSGRGGGGLVDDLHRKFIKGVVNKYGTMKKVSE
jgi:hypothetical protein